jgi:hypothetical protein|tara:strand:- start:597 stop:1445 length:849 start_codon:yes stop_codon:yes gene_type:complete
MVSFTTGKVGDLGFVDPNSPEAKALANPSIEDDFVETPDNTKIEKIGNGISVSMRNKLAVNIMRAEIPLNIVDELNQHIDEVIIPDGQDLSGGLVGQINQNEKSAQWLFPHNYGVGDQFAVVLNQLAKTYIKQTLADTGDDDKEIKTDIQTMWTVHSYAGDYNPLHDHGTRSFMGLSCILYLKVPPQIEAIGLPSDAMIASGVTPGFQGLNGASGAVDGFTYLCWGANGMRDVNMLRPITEEYVKPEVGTMIIFPAWLRHAVMPFSGEGERRTFSANINVYM